MSNAVEQLIDEALVLPVCDRAKLAHALIVSIDGITESDEVSAWDIELQKRVRDIRENRVQGIPAEEVFAKLKEKYH